MKKTSTSSQTCFLCGKDNKKGLNLQFTYQDKNSAACNLIIPDYFSGWHDITHGGFLSMLLDEVMAHACIAYGSLAVTAELKVKFHKPVNINTSIELSAQVREEKGNILDVRGWIRDKNSGLIASSTGRFFKIKNI